MTAALADSLSAAVFYGVSPNEVEYEWTYIDFLDRYEFMMVSRYMESKSFAVE